MLFLLLFYCCCYSIVVVVLLLSFVIIILIYYYWNERQALTEELDGKLHIAVHGHIRCMYVYIYICFCCTFIHQRVRARFYGLNRI